MTLIPQFKIDKVVVAHVTQETLTSQKGIYPRHFVWYYPQKKTGKN